MELLIFFLLLAIGVSFLCSILEAVLLSISDSYVTLASEEGKSYAKALRALKDDIDRPLAAILSLNTVAHTVGAAGVGAQAHQKVSIKIDSQNYACHGDTCKKTSQDSQNCKDRISGFLQKVSRKKGCGHNTGNANSNANHRNAFAGGRVG